LLLLRAYQLHRRVGAWRDRRRRHAAGVGVEPDAATGPAHDPAAQGRAPTGRLRSRRADRPVSGGASPSTPRPHRARAARLPRRPALAVTALVALGCLALVPQLDFDFNPLHLQNPREEAVATLFDLMSDPTTTPYTIDVLAPSVAKGAELAARLKKLPEVAQVVTAESYVPTDHQDKIAILQDLAQLLGPTLTPAHLHPPPTPPQPP